ncbi:MAG TPA: hypothetical protein VMD30_05460 [Tepidisphaeraceae bacterium]|nr:hypothetical protein [Tepidisphaeraceae bacterium]
MNGRRRWDWGGIISAAPAAMIVGVCCLSPLLWMIAVMLANPEVRSELHPSAFRFALLGRTLGYNAAAAVIALLLGLPAAFVLGRGRGLLAKLLWVIIPSALLLPSLSYAYGWSQCCRLVVIQLRNHNFDNAASIFRPNSPLDIFRCIWSLGTWLWAVPATLIGLSLRRMDTSVQQQAVMDGALWRVTFRQMLGPIIASLAIVTILATQEFSVYEPTGISVVATEIRMVFDTGALSSVMNNTGINIMATGFLGAGLKAPDQPARAAAAVATAVPLVAVTMLLAVLAIWGARRAEASDGLETGDWPRVLDTSSQTVWLTVALLLLNIGVPVVSLVLSLHKRFSIPLMYEEFGPQVEGSILMGALAAGVAVFVSLSGAARWTRGMLAISGASFLIGGQLLAIALIRLFNRPGLFWAYDSCIPTVTAYLGRFGWLPAAAALATWARPWRELRDMGSVDGAGTFGAARRLVWPLAWPTLIAGGLLVGALSLTEVPATVLLMPQKPQVLTPTLMTWLHMARYDSMIEAALVMMGTVLLPAVTAVLLIWLGSRIMRRSLRR